MVVDYDNHPVIAGVVGKSIKSKKGGGLIVDEFSWWIMRAEVNGICDRIIIRVAACPLERDIYRCMYCVICWLWVGGLIGWAVSYGLD